MSKILFILLIFSFSIVNCQFAENHEVQFIFNSSGGRDVYNHGDHSGSKIIIYFDGTIEYYKNYFPNNLKLIKSKAFPEYKKSELLDLIEEYDFMNFKVGQIDHRDLKWPSSNYLIGYRPHKNDDMKIFKVIGGASNKFYPKNHYEFKQKFTKILFSIL